MTLIMADGVFLKNLTGINMQDGLELSMALQIKIYEGVEKKKPALKLFN